MATAEEKAHRRKIWSSNVTAVVSISLVLFMLGLLGLGVALCGCTFEPCEGEHWVHHLLEGRCEGGRHPTVPEIPRCFRFVRSTKYVSKEEAAEYMKEALGEDFLGFMGYNPLKRSIDVRVKSEFADADGMINIQSELLKNAFIHEIDYPVDLSASSTAMCARRASSSWCSVCCYRSSPSVAYQQQYPVGGLFQAVPYQQHEAGGRHAGVHPQAFCHRRSASRTGGAMVANVLLALVIYMANNQVPELFGLENVKIVSILFGSAGL
jgi:cell division transport system permease protein